MSSIINNDGLIFLLSMGILYYGLRWWREQTLSTMVKAAVLSGLGMMTKFGGILIISILMIIFIARFLKDKTERKSYLYQLLFYALITIPLGGWYYGYAYYRYDTPINYVQGWKDPHADIGSKHTLLDRFTHDEWSDFYVDLGENKNWNIWALGIKTSLFDEHNYQNNAELHFVSGILFYLSIFFFFISCFYSFGYLLYYPFSKFKMNEFILSLYNVLLLSSYVYFNFWYPHPYTANFRYIPVFFACSICLWDKFIKDKRILFYLFPVGIGLSSLLFHALFVFQKLF